MSEKIKFQMARRPDHFKTLDDFIEKYYNFSEEHDDFDQWTLNTEYLDDVTDALSYTLMIVKTLDGTFANQDVDVYQANKDITELAHRAEKANVCLRENEELKAKIKELEAKQ